MNDLEKIEKNLIEIGDDMLKCDKHCDDVDFKKEEGKIPRCLFPEFDRKGKNCCVVVGLNPGKTSGTEKEQFKNCTKYKDVFDYWNNNVKWSNRYYKRLRYFLEKVGFDGHILWTELVKCEKNDKGLSNQTIRTCITKFLLEELKLVEKKWPIQPKWPIFAVGRESYEALSVMLPEKPVVGIPHPTGGGGVYFCKLFVKDDQKNIESRELKEPIKVEVENTIDENKAIWLSGTKEEAKEKVEEMILER